MNDEKDKMKDLNIVNKKGQDYIDQLLKPSKAVIAEAEVTDETSKKIKEEAESTRKAVGVVEEMKKDPQVAESIKTISGHIKRYFPKNSDFQKNVDDIVRVREQLLKVTGQITKEIIEEVIKSQEEKANVIEDEER